MSINLSSYDWQTLTVERRIGDVAYQYDLKFHGHTYPPYYTDLVYIPPGTIVPIMVCHLITATRESGPYPEKRSNATGYSMGWYLRDDIEPEQRNSKITGGENNTPVTDYEQPTTYMKRWFWGLLSSDSSKTQVDYTKPLRGFCQGVFVDVPNWGLIGAARNDLNHPEIVKKQFGFDSESISDAVGTIAEHCHMVLLDEFVYRDGEWKTALHWVPEWYIDDPVNQLTIGIPQKYVVTKGDNDDDLLGNPSRTSDLNSGESKNCVRVELLRSKSDSETWFYASKESPDVTNFVAPRRILKYQSADILLETDTDAQCQAKTDAKRDELYEFVMQSDNAYEATFKNRYDFRLYQSIQFIGFNDVPSLDLRIIGIRYEFNLSESGGDRVTLTMTEKRAWVLSLKYKRLMDEIQNQVAAIQKTIFAQIRSIQSGTITYVDPNGTYAVARSDVSGELIQGRSWNQ